MKTKNLILYSISFTILTAITQIGGLILLLALFISHYWKSRFKGKKLLVFISLYSIVTFIIIPLVAPLFGREKVKNSDIIKSATYATILLNRNYVTPEVNILLKNTASKLSTTDVKLIYLDAGFPFFDGFPLLPHLSHNDGNKIDFSLIYENENGKITDDTKSRSGYGVFENPASKEINMTKECVQMGNFQYDYPKYFTFGKINKDLSFSESGTKILIKSLLKNDKLEKVFIEPHLKQRLGIKDSRVRYQGCHSVRHDDHIHVQVK